jgi:hypothetical protein
MYKGTNEITNKGLGFKLTNSMCFGESIFSTGFNQKTIKVDLHVRVNYAIPLWNQRGKVPKDLRGLHNEAGGEALPCGDGRPHQQAARPLGPPVSLLVAMSISHCLLGCISSIPQFGLIQGLTLQAQGYITRPYPLEASSHLRRQKL